jgi:LPS export ABC transporter protein LptC
VAQALSWLTAAAILAIAAVFLAQAGLFSLLLPERAPLPPIPNPEQITATDSTVTGLDRQNQPYEVKAARGWQDAKTPTLVHLETVEGRFRRPAGAEYTITAATGLYDTKSKTLDLAGNVEIVQKDRFTARMDKANIEVETKTLTSGVPVEVHFPDGTVSANGLVISDDGARILFSNGVKAMFSRQTAEGVP